MFNTRNLLIASACFTTVYCFMDLLYYGDQHVTALSDNTLSGFIQENGDLSHLSITDINHILAQNIGYLKENIRYLRPEDFPEHLQSYAFEAKERKIQMFLNSGDFTREQFSHPNSVLIRLPVGSEEGFILNVRVRR